MQLRNKYFLIRKEKLSFKSKTLIIVLFVIALGIIYIYNTTNIAKIIVESNDIGFCQHHATQCQNTYFYYDSERIYMREGKKEAQKILDIQDVIGLAADNEYIYILQKNRLLKVTYNGLVCSERDALKNITNIFIYQKYLYIGDGRTITILGKDSLVEVNRKGLIKRQCELQTFDGIIKVQYIGDLCIVKNYNSEILINPSSSEVLLNKKCEPVELFYNENVYSTLYDNPLVILRHEKNKISRFEMPESNEYFIPINSSSKVDGDKLILVGQYNQSNRNNISGFKEIIYKLLTGSKLLTGQHGGERNINSELLHHTFDCVYVYDLSSNKLLNHYKTNQGERIIYADEEKIMTYYNHYLITYSTGEWNILDKKEASYINNVGTCFFELCGCKIFIFDEKYKLLSTVDVPA